MLCILVGQRESKLCRYSICFIIFMSNGKIFASTSTKFYISWGNLTDQVSWSVTKFREEAKLSNFKNSDWLLVEIIVEKLLVSLYENSYLREIFVLFAMILLLENTFIKASLVLTIIFKSLGCEVGKLSDY